MTANETTPITLAEQIAWMRNDGEKRVIKMLHFREDRPHGTESAWLLTLRDFEAEAILASLEQLASLQSRLAEVDDAHHIPNSDIVRLIEWRSAYMEQDDRRDIRVLLNELLQRRMRERDAALAGEPGLTPTKA